MFVTLGDGGRSVANFCSKSRFWEMYKAYSWIYSEFPYKTKQDRPIKSICAKNEVNSFGRFGTLPSVTDTQTDKLISLIIPALG